MSHPFKMNNSNRDNMLEREKKVVAKHGSGIQDVGGSHWGSLAIPNLTIEDRRTTLSFHHGVGLDTLKPAIGNDGTVWSQGRPWLMAPSPFSNYTVYILYS